MPSPVGTACHLTRYHRALGRFQQQHPPYAAGDRRMCAQHAWWAFRRYSGRRGGLLGGVALVDAFTLPVCSPISRIDVLYHIRIA